MWKMDGHFFKCKKRSFRADRHLSAAWKIAAKAEHEMCRPLPSADALNEAFKAALERIVNRPTTVDCQL